jgi:hypothetical protein
VIDTSLLSHDTELLKRKHTGIMEHYEENAWYLAYPEDTSPEKLRMGVCN